MLVRWTMRPAPTLKDPLRRLLLLQAAMGDVQALVRRIGAICGRPKKERDSPPYNFSLYLHAIDPAKAAEVEAALRAMNPSAVPGREAPAGAPIALSPGPTPPPSPIPPMRVSPAQPPAQDPDFGGAEGIYGAAPPGLANFSIPAKPAAPAQPVEEGKAAAPPPVGMPLGDHTGSGLISLFEDASKTPDAGSAARPAVGRGAVFDIPGVARQEPRPSESGPQKAPEPLPSLFGGPQKAPEPLPSLFGGGPPAAGLAAQPAAPVASPQALRPSAAGMTPALQAIAARPLCGACMEPASKATFEDFIVGTFNRFSHAAAASAASNPGELYNPLFLYGGPGTGKTHLLQSVAKQFAAQFPNEKIWLTSGPLLSVAAQVAAQTEQAQSLQAFAQQAKALLVDDVHLLEAGESTRELLTSILHAFLDNRKQVMMTSAYAPRLLGGFEVALQFRIAAGWSGDLKIPNLESQAEIIVRAVKEAGYEVNAEDISLLRERLGGNMAELRPYAHRLRALRDLRQKTGESAAFAEALALLLTPDAPPAEASAEEVQAALAAAPKAQDGPNPAAICFPTGAESHGRWAFRMLQETAAGNRWPFPFRAGVEIPYDPNQVFGSPFMLAAEVRRNGASAALVIGPSPGSDLAGHETEFRHAFAHLVADFSVAIAWISFKGLKDPFGRMRACLDLTAVGP
ncbi:MAG: ATP-binding protein [Elusimicrobia bacterium]|nr:ATP-binding protein [Elusimicrobiota bacterium]